MLLLVFYFFFTLLFKANYNIIKIKMYVENTAYEFRDNRFFILHKAAYEIEV